MSHDQLRCIYANAGGLGTKFGEFEARVKILRPHIIGITETKEAPNNSEAVYSLNHLGYNSYKGIRRKRDGQGGGVLLYINQSIGQLSKLDELCAHDNVKEHYLPEHTWCSITLKNGESILIGCIYRKPDLRDEGNESLRTLLDKAKDYGDHQRLLIMGDFNYKDIDWEKKECTGNGPPDRDSFLTCVNETGFEQHVRSFTRFHGYNCSLLDLVFTKSMDDSGTIDYQSPLGKSDHCLLKFNLTLNSPMQNDSNEQEYEIDQGIIDSIKEKNRLFEQYMEYVKKISEDTTKSAYEERRDEVAKYFQTG